jgi:hypothetical protein
VVVNTSCEAASLRVPLDDLVKARGILGGIAALVFA